MNNIIQNNGPSSCSHSARCCPAMARLSHLNDRWRKSATVVPCMALSQSQGPIIVSSNCGEQERKTSVKKLLPGHQDWPPLLVWASQPMRHEGPQMNHLAAWWLRSRHNGKKADNSETLGLSVTCSSLCTLGKSLGSFLAPSLLLGPGIQPTLTPYPHHINIHDPLLKP